MKARLFSAVIVAAAVAFSTTGCGFLTPKATTYEYAPSDGVSIDVGDAVKVRNALFIVNQDESEFNLTMTTVNNTEVTETLNVILVIDGDRISQEVSIPPRLTQFGNPEKDQELVVFPGLDAQAGQTILAFFQSGGSEEVRQYVPILDGTLEEYKPFVLN